MRIRKGWRGDGAVSVDRVRKGLGWIEGFLGKSSYLFLKCYLKKPRVMA